MNEQPFHRTTARVLDIVEAIAVSPNAYTLTELSSYLAAPKSSIFPILQELVSRGYLLLGENGKYSIGISTVRIGNAFMQQYSFLDEVGKILQNITNVCMEASHFAILSGGDVLYLKKANSKEPIRMVSAEGNTMPAYGTALGKALLLGKSEDQIKALYPHGLKKITQNTLDNFDALMSQLRKGQTEGFTYEIEESTDYIRCIAIPVYDTHTNRIVAAISIATPTFRYTQEKEDLIKALLLDGKKKVEGTLSQLGVDLQDLIQR